MEMIVCKIFFCSLLIATFAKSHIQVRISFIFLRNVLKQTWNFFNTKVQPQWKDQKSSYQVRQILAIFSNLTAIFLVWNSVKGLRVTKNVKEIKFEGVWEKLESKAGFQRQSVTKYLRPILGCTGNSALGEKFNFYFSLVFR